MTDCGKILRDHHDVRINGVNGSIKVWDITNPQTPWIQQATQSGSMVEFGANTLGTLRNFVAITDSATLSKPETQSETDAATIVSPEAPAARPGTTGIASPGALVDGMSDLQVLNNRFWGKPQRITRNRAPRAWHEYWKYEAGANRGKQLHFINGKFVGIEDLEPKVKADDAPSVVMIVER